MRRWIAAFAAVALAAVAPPAHGADRVANLPGVDACDWASFRNGPANRGASDCAGLLRRDVRRLQPSLIYRTRDSVTATPAVVDGMLYVGAWDGTFYAFDTSREGIGDPSVDALPLEPEWTFTIGDANTVSFGRIVSSAAVADVGGTRAVIFAGGATVYALDAANGSLLAQLCLDPRSDADAAATGGRCSGSGDAEIEVESSPTVVEALDGSLTILVGQDNHNRAGIGRTGVVRMRLALTGAAWSLTPVWKFDPEARAAYDAAGEGAGFLTHGSGTGNGCGGVWSTPAVDVARDLVVFGSASCPSDDPDTAAEKVFGVRLSTGEEAWRFAPPRPWGPRTDDDFGAAPQLFALGSQLIAGVGSKDGWYYALDAPTGGVIWSTQAGQPGHTYEDFAIGGIIGSAAVGEAGGRTAVFLTTAISTPIGAPVDYGTPESIDGSLVRDPGRMLSLHALDARNGAVLWRAPLTRATYGHPTYVNGMVFVPSTVGFGVEAYSATSGALLWRSAVLNGPPSSGVAVTERGIYVGTGTRQTDAGFKLTGESSPVAELAGADPQERLAGIWGFRASR